MVLRHPQTRNTKNSGSRIGSILLILVSFFLFLLLFLRTYVYSRHLKSTHTRLYCTILSVCEANIALALQNSVSLFLLSIQVERGQTFLCMYVSCQNIPSHVMCTYYLSRKQITLDTNPTYVQTQSRNPKRYEDRYNRYDSYTANARSSLNPTVLALSRWSKNQ